MQVNWKFEVLGVLSGIPPVEKGLVCIILKNVNIPEERAIPERKGIPDMFDVDAVMKTAIKAQQALLVPKDNFSKIIITLEDYEKCRWTAGDIITITAESEK